MKILDVEKTPNPSVVRIVVDSSLTMPGAVEEYDATNPADDSHFVRMLTDMPDVKAVTLHGNWISVRFSSPNWTLDDVKPIGEVLRLNEHTPKKKVSQGKTLEKDPKLVLIEQLIDKQVRPYLGSHGGGLEICDLEDNVLSVRYIGACGGCPASIGGTLAGIESLVQREIDPGLEIRLIS